MRKHLDYIKNAWIKRNAVYSLYKKYNELQYQSIDDIEAYQLELLNILWSEVRVSVPYYKQMAKELRLDSFQELSDLRKLPIISKENFRANEGAYLSTTVPKSRHVKNSTSGSSGINFHFYSDNGAFDCSRALAMRRYDWMGVSIFDAEYCVWGAKFDIKSNNLKNRLKDWSFNNKVVSGYDLSDANILGIWEDLVKNQYPILKSYSSILVKIVDVIGENDKLYVPAAIHIGGEKLDNEQRTKIETFFFAPVYDFYGARDMHNIAQQCQERDGLHIFSENVIVEVVDDDDNIITEGEGDIVITNLHNKVMPFIRYRIGDRAKISKHKKCSCGRNLPLIDEVIGRSFDIMEFPNGKRVMGTFWSILSKQMEGIREFRVQQVTDDTINIFYVKDYNFTSAVIEFMRNKILDISENTVVIHFVEKDNFPKNKNGKMSFVIKNK